LRAFLKSKEAYEAAIASGHFNKGLVNQWDLCLMAYVTAERKLESATPTTVIPPADPNKDEPGETQPKVAWRASKPIRKTGPVGLAKPRVVKLLPKPEVVVLSPPVQSGQNIQAISNIQISSGTQGR
jgi:hypothetical protein